MVVVKRAVVLLSLLFSLAGFVQAAPAEGTVDPDDGDRAKVRTAVEKLAAAYESRRPENVLKLVSIGFSHPLGLERVLMEDYDSYHFAEILLRTGPVVTGKDSASARVKWHRKRIERKTGRQEKAEGEATLYFRLEDGAYKLIRQEGAGFLPALKR